MRKYTLRTYIRMIRYEDDAFNDKRYIIGASLMIEGLLEYEHIREEKVKKEE